MCYVCERVEKNMRGERRLAGGGGSPDRDIVRITSPGPCLHLTLVLKSSPQVPLQKLFSEKKKKKQPQKPVLG